MQNLKKTGERLESLIQAERRERKRANDLWWSYINETNTKRATSILHEWDKAMKICHDLVDEQWLLVFGRKTFNSEWVVTQVRNEVRIPFISVTYGQYAYN